MQELTLQNVSSDIQGFISSYTEDSRVKRIGLFGSVSRGEQHDDSDIDIITEYDYDGVFRMDDYIKYCIFCNALRETFEAMYAQKHPCKYGTKIWQQLNRKYTAEEIESFIRQLSPAGELGDLHQDSEEEKPWENKKPKTELTPFDFLDTVKIVRANMLYIEKSGISSHALNALKRLAAFRNPAFYKAQAMRLSTCELPTNLKVRGFGLLEASLPD